ncbi:MAG: NfeD family protein [Verrucomicrobiales bacterium]|nr:NfeD family protein [Verrucomicrobiales bacterium]
MFKNALIVIGWDHPIMQEIMNRCHFCKRESFKFIKIFFLSLYLGAFANGSVSTDQSSFDGKAVVIDINNYSFIELNQGGYLKDLLEKLSKSDPQAIILNINCSGGLASEVRWFIEDFTKFKVKTISFINGEARGAGALAALSSSVIYFRNDTEVGGEPDRLDWRGRLNLLPQRFTDLTYYDIIEDVSKTFNEDVIRAQLSKGVCDRDKEVKVNGIRFSRAGEHLVIKKSNLEELEIKGGVASNIEEVLSQEKLSAEIIHLKSPRIVIEEKLTPLPVKEGGSFNEGSESIVDDDLSGFGETRVESYAGKIVVIPIGMESLVRKTKFEFIQRIIKKAEEDQASAIIFDLNTPGGIAWYTEEIMLSDLQNLSLPTYSFVNPKAMSAGALIAIATDYIYMHEPSTIGAAAPVMGNGQDIPEAMLKKVLSDIVSTADNVARLKGHDPAIAKAFIDTKAELTIELPVITSEGNLSYENAFTPDSENDLLVLNAWEATQVINGKKVFATDIASSLEDLVQKAKLKGEIITAKPLGFELVGDWIVKLAPWLLLFGIAGAYMELKVPGFGLPGFLSLICFGLFFFGHNVAGYMAGFEAIGVFTLGLILVLLELFVFPGILVFGLMGVFCIIGSLIYSMVDPLNLNWDGSVNFSALGVLLGGPVMNVLIAFAGALVVALFLMRYMSSVPMIRWMVLDEAQKDGPALNKPNGGTETSSLVGFDGVAATDLKPSGSATINDRRVDVISSGVFISAGTSIVVTKHEGSRVVVELDDSGS